MQAIPATGTAMGMQYKELQNIEDSAAKMSPRAESRGLNPITVCSLGDASVTEGEIAESLSNGSIETVANFIFSTRQWLGYFRQCRRNQSSRCLRICARIYGLDAISIDGANFIESYEAIENVINIIRTERRPFLVHAKVPLLNHHTSGVRMEWYRDDLEEARFKRSLSSFDKTIARQWLYSG